MYKIIGTDGKEYGPVAIEEIRRWIAENRVERQTPVWVAGTADWTFLGLLPEFAPSFGLVSSATTSPVQARKTSSYAMAGLFFGIFSWLFACCCCCGFPFNVLGIVFSLVGLAQINREPTVYEGRGLAIAGLILSALGIFLGVGCMFLNLIFHPHHAVVNVNGF